MLILLLLFTLIVVTDMPCFFFCSGDYRNLIGGYIPLLGYRDLKSLLESLGGEFYFSRDKGETVIKHFDKNTAHISALIANQKKPKSKVSACYNFSQLLFGVISHFILVILPPYAIVFEIKTSCFMIVL